VNVETKEQSKKQMETHSTNKLKKFKQTLSARKLMATVFWDKERVLMVEFMQQGTAKTSEMYCKTLNCVGHSKQKVLNADICCRVPP
jgi:hypothetical protein